MNIKTYSVKVINMEDGVHFVLPKVVCKDMKIKGMKEIQCAVVDQTIQIGNGLVGLAESLTIPPLKLVDGSFLPQP